MFSDILHSLVIFLMYEVSSRNNSILLGTFPIISLVGRRPRLHYFQVSLIEADI